MRFLIILLAALAALAADPDLRKVEARLKEVARLQGVRGNQLLGYGLVVGLEGTGDKDQTKFKEQSLANLLARQGITVDPTTLKVKNVAAVIVTAELPPFAKPGQRIDVTVNSAGDAKSLAGGTLLMTPLNGPDSTIYAVAQGPLLVGGFSAAAGGAAVVKNHPTVGRIPEGALVERSVPGGFSDRPTLRYSLTEEDFVKILTLPQNALIKQYAALLETEGVHLEFREDGISEIARVATEVNEQVENIGARRLHTILTTLLEDTLYLAPDELPESTIVVDRERVQARLSSIVRNRDLSKYIL